MRTNTQVSDMRIWHVDTSARLSAKGARGLGDLCYARTEVERRAHEMQTFLHELRKLKKCQRTLDTNITKKKIDGLGKLGDNGYSKIGLQYQMEGDYDRDET